MSTMSGSSYYGTFEQDRPMRICIVTENFLPNIDGVTRTLARLLTHLREEGHEAMVLGPESGMTSFEGHEVVGTLGFPLYFYPGLSLNFFRPRFLRKVLEFDPDVIHYVDPIWLCAQAQPLLEYALPDCAAVSSYHTNLARYASTYGFSWLVPTMWALQRRLNGRCSGGTFCPSPSTRSMLHANGFDNVKLWPRGADMSLFNPSRRSTALQEIWCNSASARRKETAESEKQEKQATREKIVISYVGRISHEKNIGLLISAFSGLETAVRALDPSHPGCKLILVGDGPARSSLESDCLQSGLDISFLGYRKGEALAECYASSDIFAFPSHSETFGNVVLEALASGLPVIGLHAEGVCDLVQSGETGFLLDLMNLPGAECEEKGSRVPRNPAQLLDRKGEAFKLAVDQYRQLLVEIVVNEQLRGSMAEAAVRYAKTRTWKEAMGCLISGYREAAAVTQQRRSTNLMRALSRTSSNASLMDVRIEEPPSPQDGEGGDLSFGSSTSSSASARLLFGRPPLKSLLRRSGRAAIRKSMHIKWRAYEMNVNAAARARGKASQLSKLQVAAVLLLFLLVWIVVRYWQASLVS